MVMDAPRRIESLVTDKGYVPVYTTAIVEQPWADYGPTEHATWAALFERQRGILPGRACDEFFAGMARFGMDERAIPKFSELNRVLAATTGWTLISSTTSPSRTCSTTCSAMCRCCWTRCSPTTCKPMVRAA
jgi:phenylalanine-4-hydroxylase